MHPMADQTKSVQEGLFLYTRNVSPYQGGVFHQVLTTHAIRERNSRSDLEKCLGTSSSSYIRLAS